MSNRAQKIKGARANRQGGFAFMTALIFFLVGGTVIVAGIADAVAREAKTVRNEANSKQSYFTSESSLEDSIYRIKAGKQLGSIETLSIDSSTATSTVTIGAGGSKTIDSTSDVVGTNRTTEATLDVTAGVSLPFVLQSGLGGIDITSGRITGDVYTTGSIRGCGTCTISGVATAAGTSTSNVDQDNSAPSVPAASITFANSNSTQDLAQSFTVSSGLSLTGLQVDLKKVGSPSNATIKIMTDSAGSPSGTILASGTLSSTLASTSYSWLNIALTANPILSMGTTYWVVIDANTNSSNYYVAAANSNVYSGQTKTGRGNSWSATTPAGQDIYFKVSIGTNQAGISGTDQYNTLSVSSAYSYNANFVNATGALYCQTGSFNNKSCDMSRGDPAIQADPASDATINGWKATALAGGSLASDPNVGASGATLGPTKINGNLTVSSGGTLLVSGMIWVTGNVTINGGSTVSPVNATKSYAIVADGTISLSGGAAITGGSGGHIVLTSTNVADPAVTINGGADDTVVLAPHGGLLVSGGATAKAASAKHITISGGANLIYDPSASSLNITSGSSGSFGIKTWNETQ